MSGTPIRALATLQARAMRTARHRRPVARPGARSMSGERPVIRLWMPLTALFLILSPFAFLLLIVAVFVPWPRGVSPLDAVLAVGRVLLSLGGTEIDVQAPDALVRIKIV
ncbi:hypothetical protein [Phenylobacterium sp.]|uniref:hypothetical protein n=1 Tax=Phenylobacterium sp. TaxID=1871053 RepID=UPI0027346753|nr:hypothetical protein [Phenylobacterium sp.]MDP3855392.1 hypothetical protein [Phenylobacterium sp.]